MSESCNFLGCAQCNVKTKQAFSNFSMPGYFKACVHHLSFLNNSPPKTIKKAFYFIYKVLFVLEIFKFCHSFPYLNTLSRLKWTRISLHKLANVIWRISKTALYYAIKLGRVNTSQKIK